MQTETQKVNVTPSE